MSTTEDAVSPAAGGSEGRYITSSFPLSPFTDAGVERVANRLGRTLSLAGVVLC